MDDLIPFFAHVAYSKKRKEKKEETSPTD